MTNWRRVVAAFAITALVVGVAVLVTQKFDLLGMRFEPGVDAMAAASVAEIYFDPIIPSSPITDNLLISGIGHNHEQISAVLVDVKDRRVIGSFIGAYPMAVDQEKSRLLASRVASPKSNPLTKWMRTNIPFLRNLSEEYVFAFWMIPIDGGRPIPLGSRREMDPNGDGYMPSPGGRYLRTRLGPQNHLLFDMHKDQIIDLPSDDGTDWQGGWWSENELLLNRNHQQLLIYNIETGTERSLFSLQEIVNALHSQGISDTATLNVGTTWNGSGYDFYLTRNHPYLEREGWLARIRRPGTIEVVSPSFAYQHLGQFDEMGDYYLYSGSAKPQEKSAVYLRNVATGQVKTLVPPGSSISPVPSLPRFCGEHIVYRASRDAIWIMDRDGKNGQPLYPQEAFARVK